MVKGMEGAVEAESGRRWFDHEIFHLPEFERPILLLRWLSLLLVLILQIFDRSDSGVLFPVYQMVPVVAGYYLLLLLLMRYVRWLQRPLNYLAIDTVVATVAVFLTGGYHSSFFVLYVYITIGAAFQLELVRTVVVTLAVGLIYVGACYLSPAGLELPYAQYILAAKVLLLLVEAVLCGLLLEELRREHQETERERALARRLGVLNELFQRLSTTLELDSTLRTVAQAPRTLLGADMVSIALLDDDGEDLFLAAAAGVDLALASNQRWPVDDALISDVLSKGQPYVVDDPEQYARTLPAMRPWLQTVPPVATAVSVPLLLNQMPLGVLDVAYDQSRVFTEEELAFLSALGNEAALAIRNARVYEREREQVARLRLLDELQQSFVSSVSHELRTPLTCIKTSADLLRARSADLSDDQVELVHTIDNHVGRLEVLVNDLVEMTRLEAGQVTLSTQPTDLLQVARRVLAALQPLIERKGQTAHLLHAEGVSLVEVDRRRLDQVLTNILSNAIRFTPKKGAINVTVGETANDVQLCVSDNGPGISKEDQAKIFDKFFVVADGRGLSGLGLGLYIARQMVELHGGRIWVESQPGEGSTFCFSVPRAAEGAHG